MSLADSSPLSSSAAEVTRHQRVGSSILWSAWADALGFISELASDSMLRSRTHGTRLTETIAWSRRVGGKFGVQAQLPAGCYSDDTQLRLATSRAISSQGFDVEAFARVELTVWPAYALGGGRASRAAANNMARPNVTWSTNFFPGWAEAGGNGAAMRIQPHVWAAQDLESAGYLDDVMRNAIVTHGHPRALVGAALHASNLAFALRKGHVPSDQDWPQLLDDTWAAFAAFHTDPEISAFWRPQWEQVTKRSLEEAWQETIEECRHMLSRVSGRIDEIGRFADSDGRLEAEGAYNDVIDALGLRLPESRGSGTATVIAAMVLAAALPDDPTASAILAASAVGTDTDTIATMCAAVVGAATSMPAPDAIQDRTYLSNEADRLTRVSFGRPAPKFAYPDILRWIPPHSQLDVVGIADGRPALAGLGWLTFISEPYEQRDAAWSWAATSFGPTVLIKHRTGPVDLPPENWPRIRQSKVAREPAGSSVQSRTLRASKLPYSQPALFDEDTGGRANVDVTATGTTAQGAEAPSVGAPLDIDQVIGQLQSGAFDERQVGQAVIAVARNGTLEQLAVLTGTIRALLATRNS
jgi:ADP-ribosylglycohydrolase